MTEGSPHATNNHAARNPILDARERLGIEAAQRSRSTAVSLIQRIEMCSKALPLLALAEAHGIQVSETAKQAAGNALDLLLLEIELDCMLETQIKRNALLEERRKPGAAPATSASEETLVHLDGLGRRIKPGHVDGGAAYCFFSSDQRA